MIELIKMDGWMEECVSEIARDVKHR